MRKEKTKKKRGGSLLFNVICIFIVSVMLIGALTYFSEGRLSGRTVEKQIEQRAAQIGEEIRLCVTEYPAYTWLLQYWYDHADSLDIEYDVDFSTGTETERKYRTIIYRHPGFLLRYATVEELEALPEEDQTLCAEVAYSWLITRINEVKRANRIDFLFCVASAEPYDRQFFLFSGADEGALRGTAFEEIYPLGNQVGVNENQQLAMKNAKEKSSHLADAGDYVDYYAHLCDLRDTSVFLGMTYSMTDLMNDIEAKTRTGAKLAIVTQLALSAIWLALIIHFVLRPLKKVQKNIRLYRSTKDSAAVVENLAGVSPRNEIGELAGNVSDLAKELDAHLEEIRAITADNERIGTELALATKIQAAMLPHIFPPFPHKPEIDIYAVMDPAKEVGGDFYDFYLVDDDHLCIIMADVSGKGVPAALFMMVSKIILQSCAMLGQSPAEILTKTNEAICSNNPEEMFVTVWAGILELSTGMLRAANAGHEYPILKQPNGDFALYKDKHGFVIGGMDGVKYKEYEIKLEPGTKLFLYTDGVPEATDPDKELFGSDRLLAALNGAKDRTPEQILRQVRSAVDGFVRDAEQFDDLTMLCVHYLGPRQEESDKNMKAITVEAHIENTAKVSAFATDALEEIGCPPKAVMQFDVAIDEIFSNIARYAYAPGVGPVTVRFETQAEPKAAMLTFIDKGKPFDPLQAKEPDITASAEDRPVGGLGIFLVKKTMDEVTYEYRDGQNILRLKKLL